MKNNKLKILIAPNSFKECADSTTIAKLISENLNSVRDAELVVKPISDGGDGFIQVCKYHFGGEIRQYRISTAYDDAIFMCPVLYVPESKAIFIESAEILGLKVVPPEFRNPLKLSSKGLGELLLDIIKDIDKGKLDVDKVYIGIGGTATVDMGLGMMARMGLKLFDAKGGQLTVLPENYSKVSRIEWTKLNLPFELITIVDVLNPLVGKDGGIKVYSKQKGASESDLVEIESSFNNTLNILKNNGLVKSSEFLSGAGGGIPAAFQIFFNSYCKSSYEFILNDLKLADRFECYDYLITGEGAFDEQTLFGKGAGLLTMYFSNKVKKVFLVCGCIENEIKDVLPANVEKIELKSYFKNRKESINNYKKGINLACEEIKSLLEL